ncbi:MAG TPA: RNA-binding domain-containing protein [Candidatus Thalassarchaeaceae archaeon]|nr:RNA-binding domain-containing protein [Candidatus Thalassarchaeaceae archaeon]HJM40826.1 RNA-binding domain-containing protein [Candidatus Thalassarchaeaceae archaeon]
MAVHNVAWNATSSGVGSIEGIEAALQWLTGGGAEITREKVKSYHGARMTLFRAQIKQKKAAKQSICHLGPDLLTELSLSPDLGKRIDDGNVLHIRLSISSLVCGSIELSSGSEEQVKGRIKLEVYPGQDSIQNAREMLSAAALKAEVEGLPVEFDA